MLTARRTRTTDVTELTGIPPLIVTPGVQGACASNRGPGGGEGAETRCIPIGGGGHVPSAVRREDMPSFPVSFSVYARNCFWVCFFLWRLSERFVTVKITSLI